MRRFHELFFTLSPEKSAIEHNVKRALLLADKSVYHYYSDFAEKGLAGDDGYTTDAVASVSINVYPFMNGVEECLRQAEIK